METRPSVGEEPENAIVTAVRSSCVIHPQLDAFSLVTEEANTCATACAPLISSPVYADHGLGAKGAMTAVQIEPRHCVPRAHAHRPASAGQPPKSTSRHLWVDQGLSSYSVYMLWPTNPPKIRG